MKLKLLRATMFGGESVPAGKVLDVSRDVAFDLVARGRGERLEAESAPGPMTTETAGAVVAGKKPKAKE